MKNKPCTSYIEQSACMVHVTQPYKAIIIIIILSFLLSSVCDGCGRDPMGVVPTTMQSG